MCPWDYLWFRPAVQTIRPPSRRGASAPSPKGSWMFSPPLLAGHSYHIDKLTLQPCSPHTHCISPSLQRPAQLTATVTWPRRVAKNQMNKLDFTCMSFWSQTCRCNDCPNVCQSHKSNKVNKSDETWENSSSHNAPISLPQKQVV